MIVFGFIIISIDFWIRSKWKYLQLDSFNNNNNECRTTTYPYCDAASTTSDYTTFWLADSVAFDLV